MRFFHYSPAVAKGLTNWTFQEGVKFPGNTSPWGTQSNMQPTRDMLTDEVYRHSKRNTLTCYYKLPLIKLLHSVFIGEAPAALSYLTNKPCTAFNFRRSNNIIVSHFNSYFLNNSISYRDAILWNAVSTHFTGQITESEEGLLFQGIWFLAHSLSESARVFGYQYRSMRNYI